jgi:hypothetical protein
MKYLFVFLLVGLFSCGGNELSEQNTKRLEKINFRTPSKSEQYKMESEIRKLYKQKLIDFENIYFYNPGLNTAVIAVTETSEGMSTSDGCTVSICIFKLKNDKWELTSEFAPIGTFGKYGNCSFEKNYLSFCSDGKKLFGYSYSGWVGHQGFSNEYISLFNIDDGKLRFSDVITVMDDNSGMYPEDDTEYTHWGADYFFDVNDKIHFIVKKDGIIKGKRYLKSEDYVLSGSEFILKGENSK